MREHALGHRDLSRRGLLGAGMAGGILLVVPSRTRAQEPPAATEDACYHCVDPATERDLTAEQIHGAHGAVSPLALISRDALNGTPLYYEPSRARTAFTFHDTFYDRLSRWRNAIHHYVPAAWGSPRRLYSYGVHVNKPGMHGSGRAIDIASVYFSNADGDLVKRMDCRYDQWRDGPDLALWRRRYWALSASLHWRFRHVLTYLYNAQHHNHIHVDNAVYGRYQDAALSTGSSTQVQHVQACCRYVWGYSTAIDGIWGPQTRSHSTAVLRRYGVTSGTIASSGHNWRKFNRATVLQGSGRETFRA